MTNKSEKEKTAKIQERCQLIISQLLRDEDNKYCVDCDAKGPRWASWNLGIFLCIRCAGIHRNLGVHISKVKSVNLDTWTPEQVCCIQEMGNSKARAVYEANVPESFRRPQTDSSLEAFIRSKYEHKKYIASEWVPPPIPKTPNWIVDVVKNEKPKKKKEKSSGSSSDFPPPVALPKPVKGSSPAASRTPAVAAPIVEAKPAPAPTTSTGTTDLLGLDMPVSSNSDSFGMFTSGPPQPAVDATSTSASNTKSAEEENFFSQTAPATGTDAVSLAKKSMTTDSIMALFNQGSAPAASISAAQGQFQNNVLSPGAGGGGLPAANMFQTNAGLGQFQASNVVSPTATPYQNNNISAPSAQHFQMGGLMQQQTAGMMQQTTGPGMMPQMPTPNPGMMQQNPALMQQGMMQQMPVMGNQMNMTGMPGGMLSHGNAQLMGNQMTSPIQLQQQMGGMNLGTGLPAHTGLPGSQMNGFAQHKPAAGHSLQTNLWQ